MCQDKYCLILNFQNSSIFLLIKIVSSELFHSEHAKVTDDEKDRNPFHVLKNQKQYHVLGSYHIQFYIRLSIIAPIARMNGSLCSKH